MGWKVRLTPQIWVNDNAVQVDPLGDTEFEIPDSDGEALKKIVENGGYIDDYPEMAWEHPNAPAWIAQWYAGGNDRTGVYELVGPDGENLGGR